MKTKSRALGILLWLNYGIINNMEKNQMSSSGHISPKKENLILAVIVIIILALVFGSGFWVWGKVKPSKQERKISITNLVEEPKEQSSEAVQEGQKTEEQSQETPEDVKNITPADINVKVLNGGAAAGSAGKIKNTLVSKGYAKTEAGNANLSSYKGAVIYYQKEFKEPAREIKEIIKTNFAAVEIKEGINEKEIGGDIVVILGG